MLWRSGALGTVATTVEFDFVQLLLDAFAARGLGYEVVASTTNVDAQFPVSTALGLREIRVTDRAVILARADTAFRFQCPDGELPDEPRVPDAPRTVHEPACLGVGRCDGRDTTIRFVTTHLEGLAPPEWSFDATLTAKVPRIPQRRPGAPFVRGVTIAARASRAGPGMEDQELVARILGVIAERPTCIWCIADITGGKKLAVMRTLESVAQTILMSVEHEEPCRVCGSVLVGPVFSLTQPPP